MRKLLIVVDMQKDFIDGALGTPEAAAIVPKVLGKMLSYPAGDIYATMDTHGEDYLSTQEGRLLPVTHCVRGTEGWALDPTLASLVPEDHIFEKPCFGSVPLAEAIAALPEVGQIELIGLCTDICVVSNALLLKAYLPETLLRVDASCCAGVTPEKHLAALETLRSCQVEVV